MLHAATGLDFHLALSNESSRSNPEAIARELRVWSLSRVVIVWGSEESKARRKKRSQMDFRRCKKKEKKRRPMQPQQVALSPLFRTSWMPENAFCEAIDASLCHTFTT